ncbi:hypothetical protein BVRB_3g064580 isoform A [Beta vulgaris subsp. vulgaris]|nr:hypothetical protein BVRB_3g064580 isoform A [Beta vulgaris subsp. vulgaris]
MGLKAVKVIFAAKQRSGRRWPCPDQGGVEKTLRENQKAIYNEIDILSLKNQFDTVLPALGFW